MANDFKRWDGPYKLPDQLTSIPKSRIGLYALYLSFPADCEFGFFEPSIKLSELKSNIKDILVNLMTVYQSDFYSGLLQAKPKASHLENSLVLTAESSKSRVYERTLLKQLTLSKSEEELFMVIDMLRGIFDSLPPIYVGITEKQSLHTRLSQHCSGNTSLSQRLMKANIQLIDLRCRIYPVTASASGLLRSYEIIVQNTFYPPLSEA